MNNPIPRSSLFATPADLDELDAMIQRLAAEERAVVYRFTMHALNLAHRMVEQQLNNPKKETV